MIQLNGLSLRYGERMLFDSISATFNDGQHIGVVGRNGAGKSTLLKAIAGDLPLDEGSVSFSRGTKIAYMPQELILLSEKNVFDEAYSVFSKMTAAMAERDHLEESFEQAQATEEMLERYAELQEMLAQHDPSAAHSRTERILRGLGFNDKTIQKPVAELSVGWKMRIVLAKLLLQDADFYLFDEPTNHLDIISKEWFFQFLKQSDFGFLLVSHDRHYLERACTHIFEIERGLGHMYSGNFSKYITQKESAEALKEAAYARQQREIKQKQVTIDRFRASASKAKMAQSMIKQLEKIELIEPDPVLPQVKFSFRPVDRAGQIVLTFDNLSKSFSDTLVFKTVSGMLERGEKAAVIAPNGAGKTTLFNLLISSLAYDTGTVEFGHNVTYAIFEQDLLRSLRPNNTVLEEVIGASANVSEMTARTFLGSFLFSGDDVHKKITMLSGGERSRVAMVKVLLQRANFLLLDEPTNHLDLYSKEVLLQALQQYDGTILMVCHDHDFIERLATRVFELTPNALHSYKGTYESYLAQKQHMTFQNEPQSIPVQSSQKAHESKKNKNAHQQNDSSDKKKELSAVESTIFRLEKKIESANFKYADHEYGSEGYKRIESELKALQADLKEAMKRWEELTLLN